ncbi:MAG: type II toxin-antitoxin system MqsR family toxin [Deltaproteobacteria bacterium]|nr:type II toxin-antitoxin system MqsR family toxin [Deltaproteobacteria bacterium]
MEKKKRHYPLERVKQLIMEGKWRLTETALDNALADFLFLRGHVYKVILNLETHDFYKSMTDYNNYTSWQDVYRPVLNGVLAFIKVSIIGEETVVIQFKRK